MSLRLSLFITFLCALLLPGGASLANGGQLHVVATHGILADVVRNVAGDHAEVSSLVPVGADQHGFVPTPRDLTTVAEADVVFINGAGWEESLLDAVESAGEGGNIVNASACVGVLPSGAGMGHDDDDHADEHADDDDHAHDDDDEHADEHADEMTTPTMTTMMSMPRKMTTPMMMTMSTAMSMGKTTTMTTMPRKMTTLMTSTMTTTPTTTTRTKCRTTSTAIAMTPKLPPSSARTRTAMRLSKPWVEPEKSTALAGMTMMMDTDTRTAPATRTCGWTRTMSSIGR